MRFAIIGVGGVGGYVGARLAEAGHDVTFVARGAHGAAIAEAGLHLHSPLGSVVVQPARVVEAPSGQAVVDCVIHDRPLEIGHFEAEGAKSQLSGRVAGVGQGSRP